MSGDSKEKQARLAEKAERAFVTEQHVRKAIDEAHDAMVAKTERLREQRLAKEAAERETAPKAKPRTGRASVRSTS